jgi:hypothetical protein
MSIATLYLILIGYNPIHYCTCEHTDVNESHLCRLLIFVLLRPPPSAFLIFPLASAMMMPSQEMQCKTIAGDPRLATIAAAAATAAAV